MNKKVEVIKQNTTDEGNQDNSAYILVATNEKGEKIAFAVDEAGK